MGSQRVDFDAVRELGLALPGAKESTYFGMPALKVGGEMFVCRAGHRSAELNSLIVPVGFERRESLIAGDPDVYYLKPHYEAYPVVLVRLRRIDRDALRALLVAAHHAVSTGAVRPGRRAARLSRTAAAVPKSSTSYRK